ncbi:MAG: putative capsular polysaccharide synthesis family protein [Pseudomonadota bacterium]
MPIYHVHFLTHDRIAETEAKRRKYFRTERYSYLKRPWLYQYLRKQIDRGLNGKKWKIVTLTREPIGRNISTFFENLEINLLSPGDQYEIKSDYYDIDHTVVKLDDMQELTSLFFDRLNHDVPLVFFDRELKGVFGIDVFASDFPKSEGYKIYEGKQADVLLIRLENLNECACDALKKFLNINGFTLTNTNIGRKKDYALIYQKFKDSIALPDAYINKMYGSKYMRHFYSEEEIQRFEAKWRSSGI